MESRMCVLVDGKVCDDCGECTRCDLDPNWSRDGRSVCIDSIHEGSRQVYILDVSELTAR